MPWLLSLPVVLIAYGFFLLHRCCARRDREEGWEDKRVAASGNEALQQAWRTAGDWLARQEAEDITVQSDDGFVLHALLVPHIAPRATVLLFHGWHSSAELDFLCLLPFLHSIGIQCLLIDERAQGDSEGAYMTFGVRERLDVSVWVDYLASRFGKAHPLFLHGQSMGASAVMMASDTHFGGNVRGIVAECGFPTPYEAVCAVLRSKTRFSLRLSAWLLALFTRVFADFSLNECGAVNALRKTEYPMLLICGTADKLSPEAMAKQLYDACKSDKTLLKIEGAGHCMGYLTGRAQYEAAYREFIDKHLKG